MKSQHQELIVDSFAGGGGASLGISQALGRGPDIAINHDASAIAMHAANHPGTKHYTEDVWKINPHSVTGGKPVGLLWASPDCKHFSRAKGGKPVEKRIRSLAWVVIRWAAECQPRVIILENVREFEEWGPLVPRWRCRQCTWRGTEGQTAYRSSRGRLRHSCPRCGHLNLQETFEQVPDPARKGLTFRRFVGRLRDLGYAVAWKLLNAADFGAPTHRRRLFLIARNDGKPIVWPEPTHGDPRRNETPLFGALQPWRTAAECIDWSLPCPSIFSRKKPLAEATLRRIAMGIKRYVLDHPRPFLVVCNHGGGEFRGSAVKEPMPTVTASRDAHGLVTPYLVRFNTETNPNDGSRSHSLADPLGTVVTQNRYAVVAPYLVPRFGEAQKQEPRTRDVDAPFGVLTPDANNGQLVAAFLAKHYGGVVGSPLETPIGTVTSVDHHSLVAANLIHLNHGDKQWSGLDEPLRTVTTGNHAALVYSFLVKYFGTAIGTALDQPLPTATGKDRFGLVTVAIEGEPYVIVDIGLRMLKARELARGQGFADSYVLTGSNTRQVEKIGNSVSPVMARILVEANYP